MDNRRFVICIDNSGYPASLELRKAYQVVAGAEGNPTGHIRIIDESGEDYLYPDSIFVDAGLSGTAATAVAQASRK